MIEQSFSRRVPQGAGDKSFDIDALPLGWFAISHRTVPQKRARRSVRGRWCCLKNRSNQARIYRVLRFDPTLATEHLWIDYDGWLALSGRPEKVPTELLLTIRPVRVWEVARLGEGHPDPAYRLAIRLSWIMGLLSVMIGLLSVVGWLPIVVGLIGALLTALISGIVRAAALLRTAKQDKDEIEE